MKVDRFDLYFGIICLILGVGSLIIGRFYCRNSLKKIGEMYSTRDALKDMSIEQLLLGLGFTYIASSHYFSSTVSNWMDTACFICIAIWFLSLFLLRIPTTGERLANFKILKEIKENPEGISATLLRHSQSAGRMKWVFSTFIILIGGGIMCFLIRERPLDTLIVLFFTTLLAWTVFIIFLKIELRNHSQLP